ncbi:myelin basic protein isoform X2 [Austrofundulus limnaeus]|uniref:Myelin basic protein n=1 Tax=Austrofundulus limnaeus TaxID=52670 RepID=A0A2I4CMA2_AUSLI|nr:PREDICTED: myelin basic protein-like isoform X2 [Austrofundulus limnaeus]
MATASTSGQSGFGLSRKKKNPGQNPGLMGHISQMFGADKKKRSRGSFRGPHAASPQQATARRRPTENAVLHFFRSIVSSPPPKSTASSRPDSTKSPVRRRREQSTLSRIFNLGEAKSRPPPKRWSTIF